MPPLRFRSHYRILSTLLSRPPRSGAGRLTLVTWGLLSLGAWLAWNGPRELTESMPATREQVFGQGEVWRLATTLFVHSDGSHLASNSLMFVIMGYLLNAYFGSQIYPVMAWLLALPMTAWALSTYGADTRLVGASGLVHLMGGLWISLYFYVSRNLRLTQRLLRAGGVMLALFFPTSFEEHVSYRVHFIGLFMGLSAGSVYFWHNRERLRALEEVDVEFEPIEPEPNSSATEQAASDTHAERIPMPAFQTWNALEQSDDIHINDAAVPLPDDDFDFEDEDPLAPQDQGNRPPRPRRKNPRRLGPGSGNA